MQQTATLGVIGGSGLYALLEHTRDVVVETPYGPPSDPLVLGEVGGRTVAFVARHGRDHRFPPHRIPYRANLWALRSLGVRQVLAPSAVGSLKAEHGPGAIVVPDQLVDRTSGRVQTYYDAGGAVHVSFADGVGQDDVGEVECHREAGVALVYPIAHSSEQCAGTLSGWLVDQAASGVQIGHQAPFTATTTGAEVGSSTAAISSGTRIGAPSPR